MVSLPKVLAALLGALRTALKVWAATGAPASGEGSPAELAVRCLRDLTGGTGMVTP